MRVTFASFLFLVDSMFPIVCWIDAWTGVVWGRGGVRVELVSFTLGTDALEWVHTMTHYEILDFETTCEGKSTRKKSTAPCYLISMQFWQMQIAYGAMFGPIPGQQGLSPDDGLDG